MNIQPIISDLQRLREMIIGGFETTAFNDSSDFEFLETVKYGDILMKKLDKKLKSCDEQL